MTATVADRTHVGTIARSVSDALCAMGEPVRTALDARCDHLLAMAALRWGRSLLAHEEDGGGFPSVAFMREASMQEQPVWDALVTNHGQHAPDAAGAEQVGIAMPANPRK